MKIKLNFKFFIAKNNFLQSKFKWLNQKLSGLLFWKNIFFFLFFWAIIVNLLYPIEPIYLFKKKYIKKKEKKNKKKMKINDKSIKIKNI